MRIGFGFLVVLGLLAIAAGPRPAQALSLADLAGGSSVTSLDGGITFDDFVIEIKGKKANKDLSDYLVTQIAGGFAIDLSNAASAKGKILLDYSATATSPQLIISTALALQGDGKTKAKATFSDGGNELAQLKVKSEESASALIPSLAVLTVREKIKLKKQNSHTVAHTYVLSAPEPSAPLLIGSGAAALLARRRRGRARNS
jgi:hypothetical protein